MQDAAALLQAPAMEEWTAPGTAAAAAALEADAAAADEVAAAVAVCCVPLARRSWWKIKWRRQRT